MGTDAIRTRPITSPPAPPDDPYFYGWRMVPRWDDRKRQTWEKVPLTPWDVLHPEEEDFIVTNDAHDRDIHYLKDVFEECVAGRSGVRVLCDHRVLWEVPALGAHGPDVVVFENLNKPWNARRGTFPVKEMGARPLVIVEVTSPSTRYIDLDDKIEDYYRAGVPLYVIADRRETYDGQAFIRLMAYRTTPEGYVRVPEDPNGVWIEALKVWVQADGDRIVCVGEHGNRIPDLRDQRDAERQRAESEKQRADTEQVARIAAEQKLKELEAELKRLRGDTN
ncbi:Uma2 family endonuclease [Frigoriglobus tundricola]|uniref:Putative restriction endonuclease domain-containing protein n=1 Tax=Frigoriglobus tundricola TaxID=2774151 RepID=A0A6M5Z3Z8_9BACT|nr:Uma2 family endonuclease [Frigoriglobus tundricola]QJX00816.1 hypothetical protein FTUN_8454 [Frigoriglobus tundricola]